MSASSIATMLDVARNTVQAWINRGCPVEREPRAKGDSYDLDLAEVVRWLQAQQVEKAVEAAIPEGSAAGEKETLEEAQRRRAVALANIAEIEEAEAAALVVPIGAVEAMVSAEYLQVRTKLENLGSVLAGRTAAITDPGLVQKTADRLVSEALDSLKGDVDGLVGAGD